MPTGNMNDLTPLGGSGGERNPFDAFLLRETFHDFLESFDRATKTFDSKTTSQRMLAGPAVPSLAFSEKPDLIPRVDPQNTQQTRLMQWFFNELLKKFEQFMKAAGLKLPEIFDRLKIEQSRSSSREVVRIEKEQASKVQVFIIPTKDLSAHWPDGAGPIPLLPFNPDSDMEAFPPQLAPPGSVSNPTQKPPNTGGPSLPPTIPPIPPLPPFPPTPPGGGSSGGRKRRKKVPMARKASWTDEYDQISQQYGLPNLGSRAKNFANAERVGAAGGEILGAGGDIANSLGNMGVPYAKEASYVLKFGEALVKGVDNLRDFGKQLHESNIRFHEFSAAMTRVKVEQEVREMRLSQERGERRAASAGYLARAQFDLEKELAPIEDTMADIKNILTGFTMDQVSFVAQIGKIVTGFNYVRDILDWLKGRGQGPGDVSKQLEDAHKESWEKEYGRPPGM